MAAEPHLTDTNILLRLTRRDDPDYGTVRTAVERLRELGSPLCYAPQNLVEFWNVATRPKNRNGFGLSISDADQEASLIENELVFLADNDRIHQVWRELVVASAVSGVQVRDARLVAVMQTHGIRHVLTLNETDFARYPNIKVVHPNQLARK